MKHGDIVFAVAKAVVVAVRAMTVVTRTATLPKIMLITAATMTILRHATLNTLIERGSRNFWLMVERIRRAYYSVSCSPPAVPTDDLTTCYLFVRVLAAWTMIIPHAFRLCSQRFQTCLLDLHEV